MCKYLFHSLFLSLSTKVDYAITIHKSQGITFDKIVVGINQNTKHISCGLVYVAMSRVRTKEKLHILNNFPKNFIITDDKVYNFYNEI